MTACRSLSALNPHDETFQRLLLRYKVGCISKAREALLQEGGRPSDETIAVALWLAAEEVSPALCVSRKVDSSLVSDEKADE
jgi:hypothetical protein